MNRLTTTISTTVLLAAMSFVALPAQAENQYSIGAVLGTAGYGPQLGAVIVPQKFATRLSMGYFSYNYKKTSDDVDYSGKLKLNSLALLGDWHPFSGVFRLTGGLVSNKNKISMDASLKTGHTYTTDNNVQYTAGSGDSASTSITFNKNVPYLGFGWGGADVSRGFHFTSDFGILFQGKPKANVSIHASNQRFQADADKYAQDSQAKLQSDVDGFRKYPVIQLGLNYRF